MFWSIFVWVGFVFCAIQRNWMSHPRKTDAQECSAQTQIKNLWFLGKMITWTFDLRLGSIPWHDIRVRIWHWYISVWRGRRGPPVSWCRRCYGIQPQATWQNGHEWTQQYLLSLGKKKGYSHLLKSHRLQRIIVFTLGGVSGKVAPTCV